FNNCFKDISDICVQCKYMQMYIESHITLLAIKPAIKEKMHTRAHIYTSYKNQAPLSNVIGGAMHLLPTHSNRRERSENRRFWHQKKGEVYLLTLHGGL
ncbi:MAG: hypothetical protein M3288_03270, partial [Thermoproteota archaeon]|nr:hypothetical protein [Thermoproteota archaeon]